MFNTIKHCLDGLPDDYLEYYKRFVLFVEDVNITSRVLEVVLRKSKYEVEDIITEFKNKSLVVYAYNKDLQCYVYGIHDLLLSHLKTMLTEDEKVRLHRSLIQNYLAVCHENFANLPNDNYIFTYIGHHLMRAQQWDVFAAVYFDLDFIGAKIRAAGIADLIGDFRRYKKHITKNNDPAMCKKLEAFELFVQKYGQDLHKYLDTDIVQCGLQQVADSEVYRAALDIAHRRCDRSLYFQTQFIGQTVYVTHTLDLKEDVCAACFAHRADNILVGTASGEIRLWDHSYKSLLKTFRGHSQKVTQLQVSVDMQKFLSVSEDGCVKVWSLKNACLTSRGKTYDENGFDMHTPSPRVRQDAWVNFFGESGVMDDSVTFELESDCLTTASFSHMSERYLVAGSQKGAVVAWDLETAAEMFRVQHKEGCVTCCTFSLDDRLVLFSCENVIFAYDLELGEYLSQFVNDVRTTSLLVIPYWHSKIVALSDKSVSTWQWQVSNGTGGGGGGGGGTRRIVAGPVRGVLDSREDAHYICASVTWDGIYLVAGASDHCINMWNIETREKVKEISQRYGGLVMCLDTFLNEGTDANVMYVLLSGSDDGSVKQWHVGPLENHAGRAAAKLSVDFAACWLNGQTPLIAAIDSEDRVQVFAGHALISETERLHQPRCVTFSPCGQELALGLADGMVKIFNYRNKSDRAVMTLVGRIQYLEYLERGRAVMLVSASASGCLMVHADGKSVRLKDEDRRRTPSRRGEAEEAAGSRDRGQVGTMKCFLLHRAQRLLSVEDDGCMKCWTLADGTISDVLVWVHHGSQATMAAMTPKQDMIAVTFADATFKVYGVAQQEARVSCTVIQNKKLDHALRSCCFSNDGLLLAIGKDSGDVLLWDVDGMTELATLKLHSSWVRSLVFSPPPAAGAPLVLVSVGDQVAWWDVSHVRDKLSVDKERRMSGGRRSVTRLARPQHLPSLEALRVTDNVRLLTDSVWTGKQGRAGRPELLCAIKLAGHFAAKISISSAFTSFVTVDASGLLYIMNVLKPAAQ